MNDYGWNDYSRRNPRPSYSLTNARASWSAKSRVRYDTLTDRCWTRSKHEAHHNTTYIARPLSKQWRGKFQPVMDISSSHLVVAAARTIYIYSFRVPNLPNDAPPVDLAHQHTLPDAQQARCDITSIAFVSDELWTCTLLVGFQNGGIEQLLYQDDTVVSTLPDFTDIHGDCLVESIKTDDQILLSLASSGHAALTNRASSQSSEIYLQARSWVSMLSLKASTPFAAFGMSSTMPLAIHSITEQQLSPTPSCVLVMDKNKDTATPSGVYGLSSAPFASPWGSSPQIIVSGWYDGHVRCHDLRASDSLRRKSEPGSPSFLCPVLSMSDPLLCEPIYSVSSGGGTASHIAAGSARHSVVSFWDVRSPRRGWSVHAPGNDSSPVYDLILESSRVYGVTQSRPFVLDFVSIGSSVISMFLIQCFQGPGVGKKTYPYIPRNTRDGLISKKGDHVGFYVTQYSHRPSRTIDI